MLEYLIRDALVVDGTGKDPYLSNIGVEQRKIRLLDSSKYKARKEIQASGLILSPGFIDMHSHSDLELLRDGSSPDQKVRQGITTEVLAQDGYGVAPVSEQHLPLLADLVAGLQGKIDLNRWRWRTFRDYINVLEDRGLPNNVALLASHAPIRIAAMGMEDRPATDLELETMRRISRDALEAGAFGMSSGLIYPPQSFSNQQELIALNEEVAAFDGVYMVHQRDEGYLIRQAFEELIHVATETSVHLHISHLQAYGQVNWPLIDDILDRADVFIESGGKISWDRYPYLAGCTVLSAVLPDWTFSEGTRTLIKNLRKPDYVERIKDYFEKGLDVWNNRSISVGWDKIIVTGVTLEKNRWMEGKSCAELAQSQGQNPIDFVCALLAEEELAVTMISFFGSDDVLNKVMSHKKATVGSDGVFLGRPHPRLYGTYARYIQRFVREQGVLSLPAAIRKATGAPAQILGLPNRGLIRDGYMADLVLFSLDEIADNATYDEPKKYPSGIPFVFVNGELIVENGQFSQNLPGKVLRKTHG